MKKKITTGKKAPLRVINTKPNRAERRKVNKAAGIDEKKMNAGGFYAGMPGVFLDADGNRKMYEVLITPEGEVITKLGCHPVHLKQCLLAVIEAQPIFRSVIMTVAHQYADNKAKAQAASDAASVDKLNMKPKKKPAVKPSNIKTTPKATAKRDSERKKDQPFGRLNRIKSGK